MKKISVKANEEFRVKLITDFSSDEFFYNAFIKAKKELDSIVKDTISYYKKPNDTMFDFSNNIIAFSGDRGQGKSSAMLSFSNILRNNNQNFSKEFLGEKLCKNNFIVLDRIDPTKFENNDNILLIILAKIFNEFCDLWKTSDKSNILLYSNLLDQFQICCDEIMTIKNKGNHRYINSNVLDKLGRLGDSGNLKKHLWDLLQTFFKFRNSCHNNNLDESRNFLVIQLDDTDLNTEKAYTIVEDIRKYFMIPNVVILMAIDINQLTKAIEQYFINNYKEYNNYYDNKFLHEHRQVAVKYIDKLIPGDRKVYLPKLAPNADDNGEIVELEYWDENENILDFKYRTSEKIKDLQEIVLRLIYKKTGIIFIKPKTYIHDIIPKTMRELVNFLSVLNKMPNIKNDYSSEKDLKQKLDNLKNFETFFVNVWIPNSVEYKYLENIENFIAASWVTKNKQFIKDLKATIYPTLLNNSNNRLIINSIDERLLSAIRVIEKKGNYSFADIRTVLFLLEDEFPQEEIYKFSFAIKTLYSIYLNKIICAQLINELNFEPVDYDLLLDFTGGELFSNEEVNNFMRADNGVFNRGAFNIVATYNYDAKNRLQKIMSEHIELISFFINFYFPSSQEKLPDYRIPYKAANGFSSTHFKFNACAPILKLVYPMVFLNRIDNDDFLKNVNYDFWWNIRFQFMEIVSNTDLINYLSKKLKNLSTIRSDNWDYSDHLINLYDRLEDYIIDLKYYDIRVSFESLKSKIQAIAPVFNELHEIYKELDEEFDSRTIETREALSKSIAKLNALRRTRTFESLQEKVDDTLRMLNSYNNSLKDENIYKFISKLEKLKDIIQGGSGEMNSDSRTVYQGEYNRIIKDLKREYEE